MREGEGKGTGVVRKRKIYNKGRSIRARAAYPRQGRTVRKSWSISFERTEALRVAAALIEAVIDNAETVDITVHAAMLKGGYKTTVTAEK